MTNEKEEEKSSALEAKINEVLTGNDKLDVYTKNIAENKKQMT